jgi:hypothetical protein
MLINFVLNEWWYVNRTSKKLKIRIIFFENKWWEEMKLPFSGSATE